MFESSLVTEVESCGCSEIDECPEHFYTRLVACKAREVSDLEREIEAEGDGDEE